MSNARKTAKAPAPIQPVKPEPAAPAPAEPPVDAGCAYLVNARGAVVSVDPIDAVELLRRPGVRLATPGEACAYRATRVQTAENPIGYRGL